MSEAGREYWSKLITEQEASGEKVKPFCREHGIGEASFYYWRRRLREDRPVRFALLETRTGKTESAAALELILRSGERLRIGAGVDAATLRLVLDAVRR